MRKACFELLIVLIFIPNVFAIVAVSDNYTVSRFGTGVQASALASDNLEGRAVLLENVGTRNARNDYLTANIGFWGDTVYHVSVSITTYSINPASATIGSTIGLSISAANAESVWAKITSPNDQEQTITLVNGGTVNYLPSPSVVGTYEVILYANNSAGDIASIIDHFDLIEVVVPGGGGSSGSGGGGGGTTTVIESCTYNWDCTPWSLCSEGIQKRQCNNIGTCKGTESKPKEEITCSEALFDISLRLNDINLTVNKTLKFGIELTEKIGVDKIDVHIKYSIIDNENNEVFSQLETKAIQQSLAYEKEIKEITLGDGEYILRVDVLYGNLQRAFAEQKFRVGEMEISEAAPEEKGFFEFLRDAGTNLKILGLVVDDDGSYNSGRINVFLIIFSLFILFLLRKRFVPAWKHTRNFFGELGKKHPKNSVKGLVGKKVYSENGHYLGKVSDVILMGNKVTALKVNLDKRHKSKVKGIIVNYKNVRGVSEVIMIDDGALKE